MSDFVRDHFFNEMNGFFLELSRREGSNVRPHDFEPGVSVMFFLNGVFSFPGEVLFVSSHVDNWQYFAQVLFVNFG